MEHENDIGLFGKINEWPSQRSMYGIKLPLKPIQPPVWVSVVIDFNVSDIAVLSF
jgi:hypothetical protein